jgi:Protein of unknown function (DUF2721)
MAALDVNPFSVLTFIAAPAILTNASSVMALGTSNRFARVMDRSRILAKAIHDEAGAPREVYLRMLGRNERRGDFLVRALRAFYLSLGCFAGASLVSLLGASIAALDVPYVMRISFGLALAAGIGGVSGLIAGCIHLVRETTLAQLSLHEEADLVRREAAV